MYLGISMIFCEPFYFLYRVLSPEYANKRILKIN